MFFISNRDEFVLVSEMHRIFTRQITSFYQPTFRSSLYQRGIINIVIKIYNVFPSLMKNAADNSKTFKTLLN
jgi:hypothetical protein